MHINMREKGGILISLWFVLIGSCVGRFVVEKNSLKLTAPSSLKDVYECAIGNFGVPQYGGSMSGTIIYPQSNQKSCKDFTDFDLSFKSKPGSLPIFLLADRGGQFPEFGSHLFRVVGLVVFTLQTGHRLIHEAGNIFFLVFSGFVFVNA